jgi:hypothetical protein
MNVRLIPELEVPWPDGNGELEGEIKNFEAPFSSPEPEEEHGCVYRLGPQS